MPFEAIHDDFLQIGFELFEVAGLGEEGVHYVGDVFWVGFHEEGHR